MASKENKNEIINFLKQANSVQKAFIFIICSLYPLFVIIEEINSTWGTDMEVIFGGVLFICLIGFFVFKDYK